MLGVVALAVVAAASAPVPLHRVEPRTPVETSGSGLGPTVSTRLAIDPLGRVVEVEILKIDPASEFDDVFRKETVASLRQWRFAPALRAGAPVPAQIEFAIRYRPKEEQGAEAAGAPLAPMPRPTLGPRFGEPSDELRWAAYVAGLPRARRDALLADRVARAEGLLVSESRKVARTPRFDVVTDAPSADAPALLGQLLEASLGTVFRIFGDRLPPQPDDERIRVYVYRSREAFRRLHASYGLGADAAGFLDPLGLMAFHLELPSQEDLVALALHEGTHAYLERRVVKPGVTLPVWLGEGFAEYVANSEIRDGKVVAGAWRRNQLYHGRGQAWFGLSGAQLDLATAREAIRKGEAIALADLVAARPADFYGARFRFFYAQSWLFVHFLRHGRPEWAERAFPGFMLAVAEGFDAGASLRAAYGVDAGDLEREFREYVRKF